MMFTKVGCDRIEQPCRHSPAHQSMSIVKDYSPKDICQVGKLFCSEFSLRITETTNKSYVIRIYLINNDNNLSLKQ